jgi:hypothetical protein
VRVWVSHVDSVWSSQPERRAGNALVAWHPLHSTVCLNWITHSYSHCVPQASSYYSRGSQLNESGYFFLGIETSRNFSDHKASMVWRTYCTRARLGCHPCSHILLQENVYLLPHVVNEFGFSVEVALQQ